MGSVRAATLAAGTVRWALAPDRTRAPRLPILGMFLAFSVGIYVLNAIRPGRIALLYKVALVFDLGVVFFLVRITGGFSSDPHLAVTLLVALHVLGSRLAPGDDRAALLAEVQSQISRMSRTLTGLLQHARPVTPERIAVEINGLLEQSLQFLPRGDIQIVRRLDGLLPAVYVDPSLLTRSFSTSS